MNKQKSQNKLKTPKQKTPSKTKTPSKQPLPPYLCPQPAPFITPKLTSETHLSDNPQLLQQDLKRCAELLTEYIASEKQTQARIQQLREFTCQSGASMDSSLPFYTCKSVLFNQYLVCLKMYELFRLNGADFSTGAGLRLYQRLVYLKTLILKLAPVQKKLEYQKNKLLKKGQKLKIKEFNQRATDLEQNQLQNIEDDQQNNKQESQASQPQQNQSQDQQKEDNLVYKPMVKNLLMNKNKKSHQKQGKYVAPRQSAVLPAEQKIKRRQERQEERRKAHLLRKFRGDIEEGDQAQERHLLEGIDERFKKRYQQKLRFEEQNFTRLNETKKQKYLKKQMMKNRFNNSLNKEIKEIQMIRELVQDQKQRTKRPTPISMKNQASKPKPQKKRKIQ